MTVVARLALSPSEICGIILGDSCAHVYNPLYNWTLPLSPIPKPPVESKHKQTSGQVLRILQLSDTHIQTDYVTGSNAACSDPLCCKASEHNVPPEHRAGYWVSSSSKHSPSFHQLVWHAHKFYMFLQ